MTVGNDARKAVAGGFPVENVVCSDLERGEITLAVEFVLEDVTVKYYNKGFGILVTSCSSRHKRHFQCPSSEVAYLTPKLSNLAPHSMRRHLRHARI